MELFGTPKSPSSPGLAPERKKLLKAFEKSCGVRFKNEALLNLAFSHRSYSNENPQRHESNERLEFLGDSVLGVVVASYLYRELAEKDEGDLAKIKSFVVSEDILSEVATRLGVSPLLLMGRGEELSGGRTKKALLADALEAVFGAYYLDAGLAEAEEFILRLLKPEIAAVLENRHKKDYKTLLQELVQRTRKSYPQYFLVEKSGPDHDKTFSMEVKIGGVRWGTGSGKSKKEAEQQAAGVAYEALISKESAEPPVG